MAEVDQEFQLLDFPQEVLINIFKYFDDCTLIKSIEVCYRFKITAEMAVQNKYNGNHDHNYYQLQEYAENPDAQRIQHQPFLRTFANQIKAVKIRFSYRDVRLNNWMIELIMEYCPNMLKLILGHSVRPSYKWNVSHLEQIISGLPQLRFLQFNNINLINSIWSKHTYPSLTEFVFNNVDILDLQTLQEFLGNNRQLKSFKFDGLNHVKFAAFDGSNLRELTQEQNSFLSKDRSTFFEDSSHVQMEMLQKICVGNSSIDLFEKFAAGCENIEILIIFAMTDFIEITEIQMESLRSFQQIKKLILEGVRLTADQVKTLITQSPILIEFECTCADEISIHDVHDIVLHAKNHCQLVEIRLSSTFAIIEPFELGMEFHNCFKNNAKTDLKLVLFVKVSSMCPANKIIITKDKITGNGALLFWNDNIESSNDFGQSKIDFLQLTEKCFEKIIGYMNQLEKLALYQTCRRMQKLIEPMFQQEYAENSFSLRCDSPKAEYFIRYFGKYMTNIIFGSDRECTNTDGRCTFHWELINKHCAATLASLTVEHSSISPHILSMDEDQIFFPNLKMLKFLVPINHVTTKIIIFDDVDLLYSFCPNLEHLEFNNCVAMMDLVVMNFDDGLSNLTTLRLERYIPVWIEFLRELNDTIHCNLRNLTLQNVCDATHGQLRYQLDNEIVNEIVRFPNLKSLDLLLGGNQNVNMKFLLEYCSKLEVLSIIIGSYIPYQVLENIKKICNKLETLKIVVKRSPCVTGLLYLDEVRKYFPPKINIKVYEADDSGIFTKGFILDNEWLAAYKKFHTCIHD